MGRCSMQMYELPSLGLPRAVGDGVVGVGSARVRVVTVHLVACRLGWHLLSLSIHATASLFS